MKQNIIEKAVLLAGVTTPENIEIIAETLEQEILIYCNRRKMQEEMDYLFIKILADVLKNGDGITLKRIKSKSEGDLSVSYGGNNESATVLDDYKSLLNQYRRIVRG